MIQSASEGHVTHLSAVFGSHAACGRWSKWLTLSAARVTCLACRQTWDFAIAERTMATLSVKAVSR